MLFKAPESLHAVKYIDYCLQHQGKYIYGELKDGWLCLQVPTATPIGPIEKPLKVNGYCVERTEHMRQV
jgi:hypothetical protein